MKLKMNFKSLLLMVSLMMFGGIVIAQRVITGKITDKQTKETLIGANVKVVGTNSGAVSDIDGNYSVKIPAGATQLEFSYTGYTAQIVTLATSNVIDVELSQGKALEELVVVGYGTQKRKDLTGSITSITSENFVKGPIQTPEQLVMGKVAGLQITTNGGQPGSGSTMRIRGGSSLNASNEPLIVIDGVPVDNTYKSDGSPSINGAANPLSLINPNDIESITVLKDASSTAIFGARASNGVIMIVTKKGDSGRFKFNVSNIASLSKLNNRVDVLSAQEYRDVVNQRGTDAQKKLLGNYNTDWQDLIYRTAKNNDFNISASGSIAGAVPIRVSVNRLDQNGILLNSSMNRTGASVNLSPKLFNNALKVDVNYKISHTQNHFADKGAIGNAVSFDPTQSPYSTNAELGGYFEWTRTDGTPNNLSPRNPLSLLELKKDDSKVTRQIGNVKLDYNLPFFKALTATVNVGADIVNSEGLKETPHYAAASFNTKGYRGEYNQQKTNKLFDAYLTYSKQIKASKLDVTAGHSYQNFYNATRGFDIDSVPDVANSKLITVRPQFPDTSRNVIMSFFGRAVYNIMDKYIITGTLRADGSSRFSKENRWGYFPSAAVAWKLSEESFIKNMNTFSDLKLRLGYGITGQQDVNCDYCYFSKYTPGQATASHQIGNQFINTLRPEGYDQNFKWETTTTYNVALDYGFAKGKVFGSVDFYRRNTNDLIGEINVPAGSNLKNRILTNVGSLYNKGVELVVNYNIINTNKTNWTVGFNATRNINKVTKLSENIDSRATGIEVGGIDGGVGNNIQIQVVGQPRNTFLVYKQVYDTNGKPIEGVFEDLDGNGVINQDDRYYYNSPNPQYYLGFSNALTYKNLNFGFTLRSNIGNYMYNNVFSNKGVYDQISTADGFLANIHANALETNFSKISATNIKSDYYMENASFLRMDNIYLGYNFSSLFKSKINLNASFNIQNAFVITKYRGLDPEIFSGIDKDLYPRARTYALAVNLGF